MRTGRAFLAGLTLALAAGCGSAKVELAAAPSAQPPPPAPAPAPAPTPQPVAAEGGDAVLEGDRIKIARNIFYDVDKDEIRPESFPILNAVANIVKSHPEIVGLTVEGHTDNQGTADHNIKLSERRANAVVRYLVSVGVTTPMQAPGYGAASPVCFTDTEDCRAQNRRVEFRVKRK
ncbi:MAG: OmpA family protein [Polyangiaceae bacterium]|nr:OmpA family protein [Polyangiaceae bacterium]